MYSSEASPMTHDLRFCPRCQKDGLKSKVFAGGSMSTAMAGGEIFWDEEGVYHFHETNTIISTYQCSLGHRWLERRTPRCPAPGCDWMDEPPRIEMVEKN
jgi:hypothetical protein